MQRRSFLMGLFTGLITLLGLGTVRPPRRLPTSPFPAALGRFKSYCYTVGPVMPGGPDDIHCGYLVSFQGWTESVGDLESIREELLRPFEFLDDGRLRRCIPLCVDLRPTGVDWYANVEAI